jgi:hypothetical protein
MKLSFNKEEIILIVAFLLEPTEIDVRSAVVKIVYISLVLTLVGVVKAFK